MTCTPFNSVDVWDGDNGSPVIYHGRTFTGKVSVRDVLHAIGKYAFVASPYPVIISAEIHCSVEQQNVLVASIRELLGDRFLDAILPGGEGKMDELPSPESLKYKILLKVRERSLEPNPSTDADLSLLQAKNPAVNENIVSSPPADNLSLDSESASASASNASDTDGVKGM